VSAALCALVFAAAAGFLVNTYFDPMLDGPRGASWIWSLMALGAVHAGKSRSVETKQNIGHQGRLVPPAPAELAPSYSRSFLRCRW
jgi:hypothetical protein